MSGCAAFLYPQGGAGPCLGGRGFTGAVSGRGRRPTAQAGLVAAAGRGGTVLARVQDPFSSVLKPACVLSTDVGARLPRTAPWLEGCLAVEPWASYLSFLPVSIWKTGMTGLASCSGQEEP